MREGCIFHHNRLIHKNSADGEGVKAVWEYFVCGVMWGEHHAGVTNLKVGRLT